MYTKEIEIVLVEDNPSDIELTKRALQKKNLANKLRVLNDGVEALEYFFGSDDSKMLPFEEMPKVVLLDLKLPKVDGLEVLRKLKVDQRTHKLPVVILTSSREDKDLEECYKLGANSFITKPVEFESFYEAILELGLYWLVLNQAPKQ